MRQPAEGMRILTINMALVSKELIFILVVNLEAECRVLSYHLSTR